MCQLIRFPKYFPVFLLSALILVGFLSGLSAPPDTGSASIIVNPDVQFQTITGWEATAQAGQTECPGFHLYQDEVFQRAVHELGINRLRLEIKSGAENPQDKWSDYRNGVIEYADFRASRYNPINDNDDPYSINWEGFQFSEMDYSIETVVLPMIEQLESRGQRLFLNLNYVGFISQEGEAGQYVHNDPQEYAEFVLATHIHLKEKYGLMPDAWEVILEPDNVPGWDGTAIGNAILASTQRLEENGFPAVFIAPSTTSMEAASRYFDQMINDPGVLKYLFEFSYHRYRDVSKSNLEAIASRASEYGINTSMLEHIGSDHNDLHDDLEIGGISAWQQYTLAYCAKDDDGSEYYIIDTRDPENPIVRLSERGRYLLQYFHYIRAGAIRIKAESSLKQFEPLGFINSNGEIVLVVKADSEGELHLLGLPEGSYQAHFTTATETNVESPIILQGQEWITSIPAEGVITIHQVTQLSPEITEQSDIPVPEIIEPTSIEKGDSGVFETPSASATPESIHESQVSSRVINEQGILVIIGIMLLAVLFVIIILRLRRRGH